MGHTAAQPLGTWIASHDRCSRSHHAELTADLHAAPGGIASLSFQFTAYPASSRKTTGAEVMLSVNGGPFSLVPLSSFTQNGYNTTEAGNDGFTLHPWRQRQQAAFLRWRQLQPSAAAMT